MFVLIMYPENSIYLKSIKYICPCISWKYFMYPRDLITRHIILILKKLLHKVYLKRCQREKKITQKYPPLQKRKTMNCKKTHHYLSGEQQCGGTDVKTKKEQAHRGWLYYCLFNVYFCKFSYTVKGKCLFANNFSR